MSTFYMVILCLVCPLTSKFSFMRNVRTCRRISPFLQLQQNNCTCNTKLNIVYIVQSGKCLIDGQCFDASEVDPADESGNCDLGESSTERTTSKSDCFRITFDCSLNHLCFVTHNS